MADRNAMANARAAVPAQTWEEANTPWQYVPPPVQDDPNAPFPGSARWAVNVALPYARNVLRSVVEPYLPVQSTEDGGYEWAVPPAAVETYNAMERFHRGEAPQPGDEILAGLAMGGAGVGGLGARSAGRAVSGRAPAHVEMPHGLPSHSVEAGSAPARPRLYARTDLPDEPQFRGPNGIGLHPTPSAASPNAYAITRNGKHIGEASWELRDGKAHIHTLGVEGGPQALGVDGLRDLREAFRQIHPEITEFYGHRMSGSRRGPASSSNDGVQRLTLFSNTPGAAPAGALSAGNTMPSNFDQAFAELDAALIDLDGDGVPDVAVPQQSVQQPSNAMAGYAQLAQAGPVGEIRGTGPGESRDPRANAMSGFAGQLENRIAEGVYAASPASVPEAAYAGGNAMANAARGESDWTDVAAQAAPFLLGAVPGIRAARGKVPVTPWVAGGNAMAGAAIAGAPDIWRGEFDPETFMKMAGGFAAGAGSTVLAGKATESFTGRPMTEAAPRNAMAIPPPRPRDPNAPPSVYTRPQDRYYPDMPDAPAQPVQRPTGSGYTLTGKRDDLANFYGELYASDMMRKDGGPPKHIQNLKETPYGWRGPDGRYVKHEDGKTAKLLGYPERPVDPKPPRGKK